MRREAEILKSCISSHRFPFEKCINGGVIKSPFFKDTAVPGGICRVHFMLSQPHELHQLKKRSPPSDHSGYECEICQYIREYVVSCVRIALCRAGGVSGFEPAACRLRRASRAAGLKWRFAPQADSGSRSGNSDQRKKPSRRTALFCVCTLGSIQDTRA